jgi:ferredoxin--NADP+ reductase
VEVVRNELVEENGRIVARPSGETETIECGIVLRSVGYKGVPLAGIPFDEATGTIPNDRGRVVGADRTYAAGWIKRGPSGVIGTNKKDATETVELLLEDARAGVLARAHDASGGGEALEALLEARGIDFVEYEGWQAIDAAERSAGQPLGRPRVKLGTWAHLLEVGSRITHPRDMHKP